MQFPKPSIDSRGFVRLVQSSMLLALAAVSLSAADHTKHSRDLENLNPDAAVDVIVQYTQAPTARHHMKVTARGGVFRANLGAVSGAVYRMPASQIETLASDPEVSYISPDRPVSALLDLSAAATNAKQGRTTYGVDGAGVGVAVIDSGINLATIPAT